MSVLMEADPLIVVLRQTELIPSDALEGFLRRLPAPLEGDRLLDALSREQLLTNHQVSVIQSGKIRDLELGQYRILDKLGSGATGNVFLCNHIQTKRQVAIKVLDSEWQERDPGVLTRFRREARACAMLVHPNIVRAIDLEESGGKTFLIMEYVEGISLADLVDKTGPMRPEEAVEIIGQAALGLQHIHEAGLVHRDIKPGNMLLARNGQLKILDLGLARFTNSQDDLTARQGYGVVGTLDFIAPEQTSSTSGVDIRADIYSLGATLYFLLTGEPPIPSSGSLSTKVMALQFRSPKSLSDFRPDTDQDLQEILDKMIAKGKENRYRTPIDCAWVLNDWLKKQGKESSSNRPRKRWDSKLLPIFQKPDDSDTDDRSGQVTVLLMQQWEYRWWWFGALVAFGIALALIYRL